MARALRAFFTAIVIACSSYVLPSFAQAPSDQTAILAGGCFWCVQSDFDELKGEGVIATLAGYTGGTIERPTYQDYHDSGEGIVPHVEAVKITYDPAKISYADLLEYYVHHIDPLDGSGQFCDRGPSYRPVIFTTNKEETATAEAVLKQAAEKLGKPVAVQILPARRFWPAEDYHQEYQEKNPLRYKFYRWNCGRDRRVKELWGS
jgi:peptide-methionine (S)-S-oxide reductase